MARGADGGLEEARLPFLPQAIALAFNIDRDGMMEEPIENRRGDDGIPEDLAPGAEASITGEHNRALLIAPGDELEEQIGALPIKGDIAVSSMIKSWGWASTLSRSSNRFSESALPSRGQQSHRRSKQHTVALFTGRDAQGDGQMGFADAGRPEEQGILALLQIAPSA